MSWIRRHCIVCAWDNEACDVCGCHELAPAVSIESGAGSGKINDEDQKKAPAANGGRPLTPTEVEGGTAQ